MREEQRNFPRYPVRLPAQYELLVGLPGDRTHSAEVVDVGLRGCRLSTEHRTEITGLRVSVLMIIGAERVRIRGTIVWARAPRLGPTGTLIEAGAIGVQLEPPIPKAYAELVAELAGKQPEPAPRATVRPRSRTTTPAPAYPRATTPRAAAGDRLRVALRTGRARKSHPPEHDLPPEGADPAGSSLGLLPRHVAGGSPPGRARAPAGDRAGSARSASPPAPDEVDELLLDFLVETKTSGAIRPAPLDAMLLEFLADVPTGARPRASLAASFSDQDIDALLGGLSDHDLQLLDHVRSVLQASPRALEAAGPQTAVLAVDDDPAVLDAHERELGLVFQVVRAASLDEALGVLERPELRFCAVVSDLVMQGDASAGIVLQQQIKKRLPHCARILVSGSLRDGLVKVFELTGIVERVIPKPWRSGDVLQALQDLLLAAARGRPPGAP